MKSCLMSIAPENTSSLPRLWSSSLHETHQTLSGGRRSATVVPDVLEFEKPEDLPNLPTNKKAKLKKILCSPAFQYPVALVSVFLVNFILLIAIRPSFTYSKTDEEHKTRQFSASKAAIWAFFFTMMGAIVMVIVFIVSKTKQRKALAPA